MSLRLEARREEPAEFRMKLHPGRASAQTRRDVTAAPSLMTTITCFHSSCGVESNTTGLFQTLSRRRIRKAVVRVFF